MSERLKSQLSFLNEIEKLKVVYRRKRTIDHARFENSAEHPWHLALTALVLAEHADAQHLDLFKVMKMLLIHDLVEIYTGDAWLYDSGGTRDQAAKEHQSAVNLFGELPEDQGAEFLSLWREFEKRSTPEAAYAAAIDALQPLSNHILSADPAEQIEWKPKQSTVLEYKRRIQDGSAALWKVAQELIDRSTDLGLYLRDPIVPTLSAIEGPSKGVDTDKSQEAHQMPTIRPETQGDEQSIRELTFAAFEHMPFAQGDEHELIDTLRAASGLYLSLVAEVDGRVVGHIAFSHATASDGSSGWFALGPVSVLPSLQKKGIGTALITSGLNTLAGEGAAGCILTGDPGYYERFGFGLAPEITPPGEPIEYFQVELLGGNPPDGKVHFDPAFGNHT